MEGESEEDDTLYEARSLRRSEVLRVLLSALVGLGCSGAGWT